MILGEVPGGYVLRDFYTYLLFDVANPLGAAHYARVLASRKKGRELPALARLAVGVFPLFQRL